MMEGVAEKKREVEEKLRQDEKVVGVLRESLEKSNNVTSGMVTILESFASRLQKMDQTIQPLYRQTLKLTRLQTNVENSLTELDRVIGFHHMADDIEGRIREGPSGNIDGYLKLLERLESAISFFDTNNPSSVELPRLNALYDDGMETLTKDFLNLLKHDSKPVPIQVLNDIASESPEEPQRLEHLPERTMRDLQAIANYLVIKRENTDITGVYAQIRSNQLGRSLSSLKEPGQGGSQLSATTVLRKASFAFLKGQTPSKKNVKRGEGAGKKEREGPRPSATVTSEGGLSEVQLEGSHLFIIMAKVFLRLLQSEVQLMEQIVPKQHHSHVLCQLIKQPMDYFMVDADAILQKAKKCIARHDYPAVLSVFKVTTHMHTLLPEYQAALENMDTASYNRFVEFIGQLEKLTCKTLEDYVLFIRGDPEKQSNLPKDGTVHELTSSTMWFTEQLLEYHSLMGEVFLKQGSYNVLLTNDEKTKAAGHYLSRVLDALNINLKNKADTYESPVLGALFLMNNYHFIHKTFTRNTTMQPLLERAVADIEQRYTELIESEMKSYQKGFAKLIPFLGQEMSISGYQADKPNKAQKALLKEKFKGFNTELEELCRVHGQYSIPDSRLRQRVREDNIELLGPLYSEFFRVYGQSKFTSKPEKYLKVYT
eukprot:Em0020g167a